MYKILYGKSDPVLTQQVTSGNSSVTRGNDLRLKQEGLAVASIARDDLSPLPSMHRDHNALPSQTDRRTLTS